MPPEVANFLFEAANFLVLAALLGWLLFKPVRGWIDQELERRADQLAEVERQRAEIEQDRAALAEEQKSLGRELEQRRKEALDAAKEASNDVLEQAHAAAEAERDALHRELGLRRRAELDASIESVGTLAAGTVQRILETIDGPSLDLALARAMEDGLAQLEGTVTVECVRELDPKTRAVLDASLPGQYEVRIRPDLGAGLRVLSSSGQIDASALGFAREVRRTLPAAMREDGSDDL